MRFISAAFGIIALGLGACAPATSGHARVQAPLEPREQTADQQVAHALSRLTFGARPGDVQRVREMGVDRWIAMQLSPHEIDDAAARDFLKRYPTLALTAGDLLRDYTAAQQLRRMLAQRDSGRVSAEDSAALRRAMMEGQRVTAEIQSAKVARALLSERQLEEVMVDFWENHFSVFLGKGQVRYFLTDYDRAIRPHALGNFWELLEAVAKSPAMLFYLDNAQSSVEPDRPALVSRQPAVRRGRGALRRPLAQDSTGTMAPGGIPAPQRRRGLNENYARELLELHTLGVDGGYTQQDVINVARALTGWTIDNPRNSGRFVFRPEMHDAGSKTVLGVPLPAGRGIEDGEQVLDILASHPATARFIATKLVRRFVSDSPPPALVDRAAATFTRTNGRIGEVVRTIVTSPEFFSSDAYRSKVKTPFELVASTLRALNAIPDPTVRTAQAVRQLGQPIFGKETPNGYPDVADAWLNTGAILNRINFGTMVAAGQIPGVRLDRWPTAQLLSGASREQQVDAVIAALLAGAASPDTREILLTGRNPFLEANPGVMPDTAVDDEEQAETMTGRGRRGRRAAQRVPELTGLAQIVGLALGSPEFQRR